MAWKMMRTRIRISLWLLSTLPGWAAGFDQSHGKLDAVSSPHVRGGWVGYAVWKGRPGPLVEDHLASVRESDFNRWRAHFVLVCAARGCSPLRSEANVASRLDEQLEDQARAFPGQIAKNRVDARSRTLYLSPIFKWFSDDFEAKSGTVLEFLEPYFSEKDREALAGGGFKIRYTDNDNFEFT